MKKIIYITIFVVLVSCNQNSNQKQKKNTLLSNLMFADTMTNAGFFFKYKNLNDMCYLEVGNSKMKKVFSYYGKVSELEKIEGCAIYSPRWITKDVLIASNGCGNYFSNNDIFIFHDDSIERQRYGHIEGFDQSQIIVYLEDNSDVFLILKNILNHRTDTLYLENFVLEEMLENVEEHILIGLSLQKNEEFFLFKEDTAFFSLFGKDTFFVSNLN